ncbi:helix-turn-helix transcriptional regulator [Aquimarina latercula]|uniref:helix-turn-helix transcriptional regulator n=1 Tax=Aquimarina latercula TaxID=987 RepID=UPI00040F08E7|nr:helix-turn-helix transcriptional regulator [Aquimarina latercula]
MFKQIGENIKVLRSRRKFSQGDLGAKLELTRQQIATYEKGESTIPLTSITKISEIFNISIDLLVRLNLSDCTEEQIEEILENRLEKNQNLMNLISSKQHNRSIDLLDNYLKSIVKEQMKPINDLLTKLLVKIDLTDLKYELNEEIKNVNLIINEKEEDKSH